MARWSHPASVDGSEFDPARRGDLGGATLASPVEACLTEGGSQLTTVGGDVFVIDATQSRAPAAVLFRIAG